MQRLALFALAGVVLGCGGSGATVTGAGLPEVQGKWMLDPADQPAGTDPIPPSTVEFRDDKTYTFTRGSVTINSTYIVAKDRLFVREGLGSSTVAFIPQPDGAGTLKLTSLDLPPSAPAFWRSIP